MKQILAAVLCMALLCGCSSISVSFPTRPEATQPPLPESAYAPTDFQWEDGFLNCLAGSAVPGIDGDVDLNLMFTDYGLGKLLFAGV